MFLFYIMICASDIIHISVIIFMNLLLYATSYRIYWEVNRNADLSPVIIRVVYLTHIDSGQDYAIMVI